MITCNIFFYDLNFDILRFVQIEKIEILDLMSDDNSCWQENFHEYEN